MLFFTLPELRPQKSETDLFKEQQPFNMQILYTKHLYPTAIHKYNTDAKIYS